ncbi:MAG: hypothetical protein JSW08_01760 [archaeon]|nr:MAG: hypothetical protein JSW08_01760 [archaeon]
MKIWLIVLLLAVLFLAAGCKVPLQEVPEDVRECITNTDCVKIQTSCCPCERSGKDECISRAAVPLYDNLIDECSENALCPEGNNCVIESCVCEENKCVAVEKDLNE